MFQFYEPNQRVFSELKSKFEKCLELPRLMVLLYEGLQVRSLVIVLLVIFIHKG